MIDDLEITVDTTVKIVLAEYFSDPDGDDLRYSASSSDTDVATVARSGDAVAVTGVAVGSAEITATASDGSLSANQNFVAIVRRPTNREVLEILYDNTDGDNWAYRTNWLTDGPLDEWYGVGADADGRVETLHLGYNDLSGPIPPEMGGLSNLEWLHLYSNSLSGPIPPELGDLGNLGYLYLHDNDLSGPIPPELGDLDRLGYLYLQRNSLSGPIPPEMGDLGNLGYLYLHDNDLSGPIPPELGDLSELLRLHMHNNADLEGELPSSFSKLTSLEEFLAHGTGVCVPDTLLDWYRGIPRRRAMVCADRPADAYLVQAVQSRSHPVPVVAEKEALLRVFVTATRTTTETLPPATATFYVDDEERYSVEIDGTSEPIPTDIDEGSLDRSLNVTIPDSVIEEGLSVVIEIDPDSTIDAEILTAKRIPESGELDLGVEGVPDFELTAIPFLYTRDPDSSVIEDVEGMAEDEENHELLHETYDLLPIEEMTVDGHDPVEIDSRSGYAVLFRTIAIRAAESGSGYWMGLMPSFSDVRGVADGVPSTSSASVPVAWIIAHELGHNLSLRHAPCGGAGSPDPAYPYGDGSIGAWGYDHRGDSLIDKDEAKDLMTYCEPEWVSDYHFTNAFGHRTVQEMWRGEARRRTGPSLLVWGTRSPSGELSMDPALLVEGRSLLPEARGDYTLTGLDGAQRELFSISFDMDEPADAEEGTGMFVFLLPVEPGWKALASLVLAGPGDALFTLDGDSEATMALIRDERSGQVRAIRGDFAERPSVPPGHVVRWSRGVPDRYAWSVMTGRGTGAGP
ncbi:MAG: M66 family metalloprotease [Gemmatimonadetes bacterium]|nr:M66 family metalloprotease [Gemmatimonadota bacterium]MCY3943166.1 M66 family metalloprotease [Gemmatimonadota bacterium]